jgi:small-conductance mechanosensitive channel
MKKQIYTAFLTVCFSCGILFAGAGNTDSLSQGASAVSDTGKNPSKAIPVYLFGQTVFSISRNIGPFTASDRVKAIERKVSDLAEDPFFNPDSLRIVPGNWTTDIMCGDQIIASVTLEDAKAERTSVANLAADRKSGIVNALKKYRDSTRDSSILKGIFFAVIILVLLMILVKLTNLFFKFSQKKLKEQQNRIIKGLKLEEAGFMDEARQVSVILVVTRTLRILTLVVLFILALFAVFYILPWTKRFTFELLMLLWKPFIRLMLSFVSYIPNLLAIFVILVLARLLIRLFRFFKHEIEDGHLKIPGFYSDFALPTYNILRIVIIAFTLIIMWPYLPGSGSRIFQGVSVFMGLIISLTSASTLSNIMAGFSLTYTRAFRIGDRVKMGEVTGDVIEKSMLVTKLRTIKNEEVTIPNSKIISSEVINYSTSAEDLGLILNTTVTIGYDAPWRTVHQLLLQAAIATDGVINDPEPFVLQTKLDDFYVSYQINAYTRTPNNMVLIYTQLHQNIQDKFNEAGVEIMSPHYRSVRDGNTIAIPGDYRSDDYIPPAFRVDKS